MPQPTDSNEARLTPIGYAAEHVHVAVPLGLFAAMLFINVLLTLQRVVANGPEWGWMLGISVGGLMAVAIPFMLWTYFVVFVYVALLLVDQDVPVSRLANVVSVAFLFAAAGKLLETCLSLAGLVDLARWPYIVLAIVGLAAATYSVHRDLHVPKEDAFMSSALALFGLELIVHFSPLG